jgi:hypothetical protein
MLKFQNIISYYAEMLNQPELLDFWSWGTPQMPQGSPQGQMPSQNPPSSRREYVKQTVQNPQQQRMQLAMSMMQNPQSGGIQ